MAPARVSRLTLLSARWLTLPAAISLIALTAVLAVLAVRVSFRADIHGLLDNQRIVAAVGSNQPPGAEVRNDPVSIVPIGDLSSLVSDEQLKDVLFAARPRWHPPTTALLLHAVRLWGLESTFVTDHAQTPMLGGREMVGILLDDARFRGAVRSTYRGLLERTPYGIRVLSSHDPMIGATAAETHYDKLLQVLGEIGVASSACVRPHRGQAGTVADIVRDSLARFSPYQELEFTTCAYARWLPPASEWRDRFGNRYDFDGLAAALLARPLGDGCCNGTHVPFALVNLLRADEQFPVLAPRTRLHILNHLSALSSRLEQTARGSGGWDRFWAGSSDAVPAGAEFWAIPDFEIILNTGHHLEWIALAPAEARPNKEVIRRAVSAIVETLRAEGPEKLGLFKGWLPLTHAARAFTLLRGESAFDFWKRQHHDQHEDD